VTVMRLYTSWMLTCFNFIKAYYFNHHINKGNIMVVRMDLDQNLFLLTASFGASFSCFH